MRRKTAQMLNSKLKLDKNILTNPKLADARDGLSEALLELGNENSNVVVICADLKESVNVGEFASKFKNRFVQCGIAEQNMAGISAGLALSGKIPYMISHGAFNPYRNWDQIRLSICYPNANVKIIASHTGFSNGPDGASAEPLEDIAIMRVLPNMVVINTVDNIETKKAVKEISKIKGPVYLRFAKTDLPIITSKETPFKIGKSYIYTEGKDATIVSCGPILYEVLLAAKILKIKHQIDIEVIASPTIKPLDKKTILNSAKKTGKVITVEEHQITGGLGAAVTAVWSEEQKPAALKLLRIGVEDTFGESGNYKELKDKYGLSAHHIENKIIKFLEEKS